MPHWRNRECKRCGAVSFTASKAEFCQLCNMANKRDEIIIRESEDLKRWGYTKLHGPITDKFNHRVYKVLTSCGHEWEAPYNNILKQQKLAEQKNNPQPCPVCGGKRRMNSALEKYVEKYGRDYDLNEYEDYVIKVRGISEQVYRNNKDLINPNNFRRGIAGTEDAYHLDHKIPIIECFRQGWTPEQASAKENLQMLPASENLSKGAMLE